MSYHFLPAVANYSFQLGTQLELKAVATAISYNCGKKINSMSQTDVVQSIDFPLARMRIILFPVYNDRGGGGGVI